MENTWFCGAYWYNGFHEDGVRSALDVIEAIVHTDSITRSPSNDTTHSEPVSSTMNNGQNYAHH